MQSVLIIDDDANYRETLAAWLDEEGFDVRGVESVAEAFRVLNADTFDLIVCDLHLPFALDERAFHYGYSYTVGINTIKELQEVFPNLPIVAVSATAPWDMCKVLKDLPRLPALSKPFSKDQFISTVNTSLGLLPSESVQ